MDRQGELWQPQATHSSKNTINTKYENHVTKFQIYRQEFETRF